jgi:hypothetical protein
MLVSNGFRLYVGYGGTEIKFLELNQVFCIENDGTRTRNFRRDRAVL